MGDAISHNFSYYRTSITNKYLKFLTITMFIICKTPCTGPEDYKRLKIPDIRQPSHEGGKFFSPTHRSLLPPRKYFCYSLLLEVTHTHKIC